MTLRHLLLAILYLSTTASVSLAGCGNKLGSRGNRWACGGAYIGANPSFSPDGSQIVFGSPRDGVGDIYVMRLDGSEPRRLTDSPDVYEGEPAFSPDGSTIVFISERNRIGHVYLMKTDGSRQVPLTSSPEYDSAASFSPDGSKISFVRDGKIAVMNTDGSGQRLLTTDGIECGSPMFSPDGQEILYQKVTYDTVAARAVSEIWIMRADGTSHRRVTLDGFTPAFSPNGQMVAFVCNSKVPYQSEICLVHRDGSDLISLTHTAGFKDSPKFSPDGMHLVFERGGPGGRSGKVMIMNADGSESRPVARIY